MGQYDRFFQITSPTRAPINLTNTLSLELFGFPAPPHLGHRCACLILIEW